MKHKRVIIILLLGIWIIGILMFHIKANRRFSVILTSVDGMVSIEIPRATYFSECYANRCELLRDYDLYTCFIESYPYYLWSLDDKGHKTHGASGRYIICKNGRYFYIKDQRFIRYLPTSYGASYVYLEEMVRGFQAPVGGIGYVILPLTDQDREEFYSEEILVCSWEEIGFIGSFEELIDFYSAIESELYRVDYEKKCIYLAMYIPYNNIWLKECVMLIADQEGIIAGVLPDYEVDTDDKFQGGES